MNTLKKLNQLGLVLMLGSTVISSAILYIIYVIKGLFLTFYYAEATIGRLDYIFVNISIILLGLILIIHDLKNEPHS